MCSRLDDSQTAAAVNTHRLQGTFTFFLFFFSALVLVPVQQLVLGLNAVWYQKERLQLPCCRASTPSTSKLRRSLTNRHAMTLILRPEIIIVLTSEVKRRFLYIRCKALNWFSRKRLIQLNRPAPSLISRCFNFPLGKLQGARPR